MAISVLRLRRSAVSLSSFIINHHRTSISSSIPSQIIQSSSEKPSSGVVPNFVAQFRAFRSSNISLARPRTYDNDEDMKIGPDDILFEGCDYNHWLITMDFPKDPKPSPEEMVENYVQTAAKVLGSVEEAKKAIYACSTTTYHGFQVQVSEDVSKKFEGLPGVVFILPDSYIDPVNKQYGGDKYENGIITHRPPPIQYGRQGGRFGDRNRDFNRQSRPQGEYQQGNRAFDNRGQVNSGNFGPRQNPPPQQNYGPPRDAPVNYPAREQENHQGYRRDQMPPNQGNYNQGQRGNFYPQQQRVPPQEPNNHAPPQGGNFRQGGGGNYGPGAGSTYGHPPAGGTYGQPPAGGTYGQPPAGGTYGQPPAGGTYGQPPAGGTYGQPPAGGTYGQPPAGNYRQGVGSYGHGTSGYGQGAGSNYGQGVSGSFVQGAGGSSSVHGEDQRFSQGEQMNDLQQVQR